MNSNSELTPSETVETFEDDESEVGNNNFFFFFSFMLYPEETSARETKDLISMLITVVQGYLENVPSANCDFHTLQTREGAVPAETVTEGIYDYVENVESGSTLSTPTSSHTGEAPFASEGLGDTVIHLDKVRNFKLCKT